MEKKHARKKTNNPKKKIDEKPTDTPILAESDSPTMPPENQESESAYKINHPWMYDFKKNRSAYILGAVTLCLVGVALWQLCINKAATEDELRAYVAVDGVDTLYFKKPYEMAKISIVNYGKTPARRVTVDYIFEYLSRDTLADVAKLLAVEDPVENEHSLAPGESYILSVRPTGARSRDSANWWKPDTVHNARHVYGRIIYYDNRNVKHRTLFTFQWEFLSMTYRRMGGMNYFDWDQPDPQGKTYPFK